MSTNTYVRILSLSVTLIIMLIVTDVQAVLQSQGHVLYNMKNPKRTSESSCSRHSPEIYFHNVAHPSLSLLYLRSKAFFGVLMDQIEFSSLSNSQNEPENKTQEQWKFITETVGVSLDSAVDRAETSWRYFIVAHETNPLPWEKPYKPTILNNALYHLEYSYTMIDAVVRSGTKEIVGTVQHQLTNVIRKLEEEVSKVSEKGDEVTEQKLFKQMQTSLARMKSSFTTKLLEKVVSRAMERYHSTKSDPTASHQTTFISEALDQLAILLHAFREKGSSYPDFWYEMSKIFENEFKNNGYTDENETIISFMRDLSNQDHLINLIVQIISRDNKNTG